MPTLGSKECLDPDGDIKQYMPTDFRYRYVETNSVRNGGSLVFDWAPTVNTKFVLLGSVNSYNVDSDRNRNRVRFRGNYWSLTDREGFGPNAIGTDRISEMVQYTNVSENTLNYNIQLNGESVIGNWKIDGAVGYSSSEKNTTLLPGLAVGCCPRALSSWCGVGLGTACPGAFTLRAAIFLSRL